MLTPKSMLNALYYPIGLSARLGRVHSYSASQTGATPAWRRPYGAGTGLRLGLGEALSLRAAVDAKQTEGTDSSSYASHSTKEKNWTRQRFGASRSTVTILVAFCWCVWSSAIPNMTAMRLQQRQVTLKKTQEVKTRPGQTITVQQCNNRWEALWNIGTRSA